MGVAYLISQPAKSEDTREDMPQYILVSTQIRLENGPTICGDELSDPVLMAKLDAVLVQDAGNPL